MQTFVFFLLLFATCQLGICNVDSGICSHLESMTQRFCPGQRTGGDGSSLTRYIFGKSGPRGPPGVVNYTNVRELMTEMFEEYKINYEEKLDEKIEALRVDMRITNERIEEMDLKMSSWMNKTAAKFREVIHELNSSIIERKKTKIQEPDSCEIPFAGDCFHAIVSSTKDIDYAMAENLCKQNSSHPADILSENHYQEMMTYLRTVIPRRSSYVEIWIGMRMDTSSDRLSFYNGTQAEKDVFDAHSPWSSRYRSMGLLARKVGTGSQGIWNDHPQTFGTHGVLCQS